MAQMKEQDQIPEKELRKLETSYLLDTEFRTLVIRMLKELDLNSIKTIQSELKDILIEIKNNLQRINRRVDEAKNQISYLKCKKAKNNQSEQQEDKRIQKHENSVRSLWDNFKCTNICIMGVLEEEREQKIGNLFEKVMTEKFTNLVKEVDIQSRKHRESQTR